MRTRLRSTGRSTEAAQPRRGGRRVRRHLRQPAQPSATESSATPRQRIAARIRKPNGTKSLPTGSAAQAS